MLQLLEKRHDARLGRHGAAEVKAHPFFARLDWGALWAGALEPPFKPATDVINSGRADEAGGFDDREAGGGEFGHAAVGPEHFSLFAGWDWRDEELQQQEILRALTRADDASVACTCCM